MLRTTLSILILVLLVAGTAAAQEPLPRRTVDYLVDSGDVRNGGAEQAVTFSETIRVEGATWMRLYFSEAVLGKTRGGDEASFLRITSLDDGAVQTLDAIDLVRWQNSSAFFNGDAVHIEIVADAGAEPSRVRIHEVVVGEPTAAPTESICGATDDRVLSTDDRSARIMPVGCTGWLIDDAEGCFLTAGHCVGDTLSVVEFNVPLSDPVSGATRHAAPEDQYPIDQSSLQWDQTVIGNDWAYFGTFPNSQTEMTPLEVQGTTYALGLPPGAASGETIRITGYGSVTGTQGTPVEWSQVQTTHTGPLVVASASPGVSLLRYEVDTTGGDSGSAVFNEDTGEAIGIHTNAGCSAGGGSNQGTGVDNSGLQNALANPLGVCSDGPPPVRVNLSGSIADPVPLLGTSFQVEVLDRSGAAAAINSATLVYDAGSGDQSSALVAQGGAFHEATLPAMVCGTEVSFRVDVEASNGATVRFPFSAQNSADRRILRRYAPAFDRSFGDNFETDMGWTVVDDPSLSAGSWERGLPGGYGLREDAPWDADGSGQLFATNLAAGNTDVDGGATRLVSPVIDASNPESHVAYWRWWSDAGASDDTFVVEISDDAGANWVTLETVGPNVNGSWVFQNFRVADFVTPTNQFQIRFTASDVGDGSIVEAAVDGVELRNSVSGLDCVIFSDGFESGDVTMWSAEVP